MAKKLMIALEDDEVVVPESTPEVELMEEVDTDVHDDAIDDALEVVEALESLRQIVATESLNESGIKLLNVSIEHFVKRTGLSVKTIAVESIGNKISLEASITDHIKTIYETIKRVIKSIAKKIKDFLKMIFDKIDNSINKTKRVINTVTNSSSGDRNIEITDEELNAIGGETDEDTLNAFKRYDKRSPHHDLEVFFIKMDISVDKTYRNAFEQIMRKRYDNAVNETFKDLKEVIEFIKDITEDIQLGKHSIKLNSDSLNNNYKLNGKTVSLTEYINEFGFELEVIENKLSKSKQVILPNSGLLKIILEGFLRYQISVKDYLSKYLVVQDASAESLNQIIDKIETQGNTDQESITILKSILKLYKIKHNLMTSYVGKASVFELRTINTFINIAGKHS